MKPLVLNAVFRMLLSLVVFPLSSAHASPPPVDSESFCAFDNHEQSRPNHTRPAAKRTANLNVGEPLTVRLIYFLPSDRTPQKDINARIDSMISDVQRSYAEVMEYHGFGLPDGEAGERTFRFETDATGKVVVHHVRGKFKDEYYHKDPWRKAIDDETAEQFDLSANIYFVVLDVSTANVGGACGLGGRSGPESGVSLIPAPDERGAGCFNVAVAAHELGHAFGLAHDRFVNASRSPSSYHTDWMVTSFCAAQWLDVHRYFNVGKRYPETDERTSIQMRDPSAVEPRSLRLRFELTDPDGLHQAQLHTYSGDAVDCQGFGPGGKSGSVEFTTSAVSEEPRNRVGLRVVDVNGNVTEKWFTIDVASLHPPKVVSIPDPGLDAAVREALGSNPADPIVQLEMLRLETLNANNRRISDLTGLEYAVNLKALLLAGNRISDITPLAGLVILETLDLSRNNVSDISSLAGMTNLSHLYMAENSVTDLSPLATLTNMWELNLAHNQISDITPVAELIHLLRLELYGNRISDISPLAELFHLVHLHIADNSVMDLSPLAGLVKLESLDFADNQISDITPLAGLPILETLDLTRNNVSDISSLAEMTNLRRLNMAESSVTDLSPLAGSTILETLDLTRNNVSDISSLAGMTNLSHLYMAENSVTDLSPLATLTNMRELNLAHNQISDITPLAKLTHLESLVLYVNRISDISPLAELFHLVYLHFADNSVIDVSPLAGLVRLESLEIGNNRIREISPLAKLIRLVSLELYGNRISDISPLAELVHLEFLNLRDNPLSNSSIDEHIPAHRGRGVDVAFDPHDVDPFAGADFDGDGTVGFADFLQFAAHFGLSQGDGEFDARFDLDGNGTIGFSDFVAFATEFGKTEESTPAGPGGGTSQTCAVGLTMRPGEGCKGSGYSFRIDAGVLIGQGIVGGISIENARFSGGSVRLNQLHLTKSGNVWTIVSLH